jgi:hypothetical protein
MRSAGLYVQPVVDVISFMPDFLGLVMDIVPVVLKRKIGVMRGGQAAGLLGTIVFIAVPVNSNRNIVN